MQQELQVHNDQNYFSICRDLLKKALKKAIVRYHPDNAAKRNERKHWAALCLEISKVLTSAYNCFK